MGKTSWLIIFGLVCLVCSSFIFAGNITVHSQYTKNSLSKNMNLRRKGRLDSNDSSSPKGSPNIGSGTRRAITIPATQTRGAVTGAMAVGNAAWKAVAVLLESASEVVVDMGAAAAKARPGT
jgi:hypothetical protein